MSVDYLDVETFWISHLAFQLFWVVRVFCFFVSVLLLLLVRGLFGLVLCVGVFACYFFLLTCSFFHKS